MLIMIRFRIRIRDNKSARDPPNYFGSKTLFTYVGNKWAPSLPKEGGECEVGPNPNTSHVLHQTASSHS